MLKNSYLKKSIFHRTAEELREFTEENNIRLLRLLEYLRGSNKKVKKETVSNAKNNS